MCTAPITSAKILIHIDFTVIHIEGTKMVFLVKSLQLNHAY
jgi:hypothetical protein